VSAAARQQLFPIGARATLEELESNPHPLLAELRATEPVSWLPALDGWLVTRRDLALSVMRDPDAFTVDDARFSTGRVVGASMLTLDGSEHRRHRDPFADRFRLDAVRRGLSAFVLTETDRLVDEIEPAGYAELRRSVAGPLAVAATAHALGLDGTNAEEVLGWYDAIVDSVTGVAAGRPPTRAGAEAFSALREQIGPSLEARGLSRDERVSNAAVILFGGIETTEGMISNCLAHLLSHPVELARVRSDPSLLGNAIEESLRLEPAAAVVDRYATRKIELAGARIGARELVEVSIAGANRDPAYFADPDRFDLDRGRARHHVAFAHGPHVCIGMHLARLEAGIAVARVLDRLPGLRLERAAAPRGLVFRKPPAVDVRWDTP
jgi:cytochrome P450